MGAIESTMRWTPYGPTTASTHRRTKSGTDSPGSPGNSTCNLSPPSHDGYDANFMEEEDEFHPDYHNNNSSNNATSGVLMGANAPPLYDACLIGRWDEVLSICGVNDSHSQRADASHDSEAVTEPTCSSSEGGGGFGWDDSDKTRDIPSEDDENEDEPDRNGNHSAALQICYTDRRRNTPLHLACRRQPPPSVIKALLNHSPCEAVSARTADGLTPLHFAAYCGAGSEVVSLLVDRMRSDAAVGRAMRLSTGREEVKEIDEDGDNTRWRTPSEDSLMHLQQTLPPTRLFDRRRRTPLHCACTGFRTPTRPAIVRKLLSVDPASATLADERGRTPLSLLFDDYAEEVMEALEEDVTREMARRRIEKGGELYECWKMLRVLLQAAYLGCVSEEDTEEEIDDRRGDVASSVTVGLVGIPQDRPIFSSHPSKEVNVMDVYDQQKFSMVHAAAAVWECPPPLAKLVLKCLCGNRTNSTGDFRTSKENKGTDDDAAEWDPNIDDPDTVEDSSDFYDPMRTPDEENMRLPLHIAVCARPQDRSGARIKHWLSSSEASCMTRGMTAVSSLRRPSSNSLAGVSSGVSVSSSLATRPGAHRQHRVYNPRFGRSRSRDGMAAFATFPQQDSFGSSHGSSQHPDSIARSGSNVSMIGGEESFLQHTMVRDVLALYTAGASVVDSRTGKLPIVLAVEHGKSWETAVGPLLDAFPKPFAGGGDGGMALPDDGNESVSHRKALQEALLSAFVGPEAFVREEAIRTAGKLAKWGGVWGMADGLDKLISQWIDKAVNNSVGSAPTSPEGIIVGPGATASVDKVKTLTALLSGVAEVLCNSRAGAVSDRVARQCLDVGREFLFSKDSNVREASARVVGAALDAAGDSDDASTVMREVVLNIYNEESSVCSVSTSNRGRDEDAIVKHGKLLACTSILSIKHGSIIMANQEIGDAVINLIRRRVKDKNTVVRAAAYRAVGPIIGKSPCPADPKIAMTTSTIALKELRSDILKGTRATEQVEVQLALARGLISASKIHPSVFLCKAGMPIMDAALMLAMSTSTARPNVQKAFQVFLWVALQISRDDDFINNDDCSHSNRMSGGLEKYIELAEGDNGGIMMTFVTRTLQKMENVDEQFLVL
ncbi:hypothetical protein HJC23_013639 [Cyclotella cryptica]|uniref:Ankyrin repeat protein n=1 Tax=Cyclotella cryptica TaxID=29204 RepID=A0ABD3P9E3_9STRA|eukprot:CCRYP_016514-RA/>CCRYP_016514-RA protein AED:0.01 eAED:0.01 QI:586/1/1/1/0.2/0.09/11/8973/1118